MNKRKYVYFCGRCFATNTGRRHLEVVQFVKHASKMFKKSNAMFTLYHCGRMLHAMEGASAMGEHLAGAIVAEL